MRFWTAQARATLGRNPRLSKRPELLKNNVVPLRENSEPRWASGIEIEKSLEFDLAGPAHHSSPSTHFARSGCFAALRRNKNRRSAVTRHTQNRWLAAGVLVSGNGGHGELG
jgi:hypothetical protein